MDSIPLFLDLPVSTADPIPVFKFIERPDRQTGCGEMKHPAAELRGI